MKYMGLFLAVEDLPKSRFLYETVLGQKIRIDFGVNLSFESGFSLHLKSHYRGLIGERMIAKQSNNFELYFEEDDLETIQTELKKHGFEFVHEIREQPWRQWVLRFYDYDKNIVEIGETMEHLIRRLHGEKVSLEDIKNFTGYPIENITALIKESEGKKPRTVY